MTPAQRAALIAACLAVLAALGVTAVVSDPAPTSPSAPPTSSAPPAPSSTTAPAPAGCAAPVVCTTADSTKRLDIRKAGVYDGQGHKVPGILIQANDVTIRNFVVTGGRQAGIWSEGDRVRIERNDISQIAFGEDDIDGIRSFGSNVAIVGNTVHDLIKGPVNGAHPDGIQTWTSSSHPAGSRDVLIQDNRFLGFDFHQAVTVEGLGAPDNKGGAGKTSGWRIFGNYFEGTSNQAIVLRAVSDVRVEGNTFAGRNAKAVAVQNGSTGIVVPAGSNTLGPNVRTLVGG